MSEAISGERSALFLGSRLPSRLGTNAAMPNDLFTIISSRVAQQVRLRKTEAGAAQQIPRAARKLQLQTRRSSGERAKSKNGVHFAHQISVNPIICKRAQSRKKQ
jgi:hypothetical protein